MDKLDKSLDEIMASSSTGGSKRTTSGGRGGGGRRGGRSDHSGAGPIRSRQQNKFERRANNEPYGGGTKITITAKPNQTVSKTLIVSRKPLGPGQSGKSQQQPVLQQPFKSHVVNYEEVAKPVQQIQSTIFNRIGTVQQTTLAIPQSNGTRVIVSNLNTDIAAHEIVELYSTVGELKGAEMKFDHLGQSLGIVEVVYARRSDAVAAAAKFDGATLDGTPMSVKLAEEAKLTAAPAAGILSRVQVSTQQSFGQPTGFGSSSGSVFSASRRPLQVQQQPKNVREGLFGVSMDDGDDDADGDQDDGDYGEGADEDDEDGYEEAGAAATGGPRVQFAGFSGVKGRVSGGRGGGGGFGGRGFKSGGRGGGGGRFGGRRSSRREETNVEDLDADMDAYMAGKN